MSYTNQHRGNSEFVEDQRKFFDRLITHDWDTYVNPYWDRTRRIEVQEVMRFAPSVQTVLDIGCGCGYHDVLLAEIPSITQVIGVDYSTKSIEQANKHYPHPKVKRFVADIFRSQELCKKFGVFDLVVSFQVIEHLSDPRGFMSICASLSSSKGYVAVVTPNRHNLSNRIRRLRGHPPVMIDPMHFCEYSVEELEEIGRVVGLVAAGHFGHSSQLTLRGIKILSHTSSFALGVGRLFPCVASMIGVAFRHL